MCKLIIQILFLNIFRIIHTQNQVTLYYQVITEQESVQSLHEIQHNQALPDVLHTEKNSKELLFPHFLTKVFTDKGRLVNPTQFAKKKPSTQFFFCPKKDGTKQCLVHTEFRPMEPLQCAEEAIPIVEPDRGINTCGFSGVGTLYVLFYKICPDQEPFDFTTTQIKIYEFCYDANKQKVLYINHSILHPTLINSNVLFWERSIHYNMESMDEFILSNQAEFEAAISESEHEPNTEDEQREKKKHKTGKYLYKAQKMIPAENMAFASWRKHTYQYVNIELQHEKLIDLWNEINHYIRLNAAEILLSKEIFTYIRTAVFDLNSHSQQRDDGQKSNMWVNLIYFIVYENENVKGSVSNAMVILMNNFIDTSVDQGAESFQETTIDDYCGQDFCAESLKNKFQEIGGQVRCCSLNKKLVELFGEDHFVDFQSILPIPGITEVIE